MIRAALNGAHVDEILTFLAIFETGSFVSGSRSMGPSRSAAGKALSRLEAHCGARRLNRTSRALRLTKEGRRLHDHGVGLRGTLDAVGAQSTGDGGEIRISAPDASGRRLVLPVVKRCLATWPEVKVEISLSDGVTDPVSEGVDLAVRIGVHMPDSCPIGRTLRREPLMLCASPAYLSRAASATRAEHLSRHTLPLHASRGTRQTWQLQEADGTWVRAFGRSRLRLVSGEALRKAALADLGVALCPRASSEATSRRGGSGGSCPISTRDRSKSWRSIPTSECSRRRCVTSWTCSPPISQSENATGRVRSGP